VPLERAAPAVEGVVTEDQGAQVLTCLQSMLFYGQVSSIALGFVLGFLGCFVCLWAKDRRWLW